MSCLRNVKLRAEPKEDGVAVCFDSVEMGGESPREMFAFVFCDFGSMKGTCACYYYQYSGTGFLVSV